MNDFDRFLSMLDDYLGELTSTQQQAAAWIIMLGFVAWCFIVESIMPLVILGVVSMLLLAYIFRNID